MTRSPIIESVFIALKSYLGSIFPPNRQRWIMQKDKEVNLSDILLYKTDYMNETDGVAFYCRN